MIPATTKRHTSKLILGGVAVGSYVLWAAGCSALLDSDSSQCSTDGDCAKFNVGATYQCVQNGCVKKTDVVVPDSGPDAPVTKECTTNQDCIATLGDFTICRKQDFKCAKLTAPDCPTVIGDWKNDNAVIIGSILPTVGVDSASGIPLLNAIALAVDEFKTGASGLPPAIGTTARRPIVVVGCSEESNDPNDADAPVRSAKHLVNDVKVPAIIGASFSGDTQAVAEVTIPAGVLLMSPTATSVAITSLADNGLVWRTAPSDVIQAKALVGIMPQVEASTRTRLAIAGATPIKVLILNKGDSYGKGLATALQGTLVFNGKSALDNLTAGNLKVVDYGDPSSATPPDYVSVRSTVVPGGTVTFVPNIIFMLGTTEVMAEFLTPFEAATWPGGGKPTYLFTDGGFVPELWDAIGTSTALRNRVLGTTPGTNNAIFQLFRSHYISFIKDGTSPDISGTAPSYDALYTLAYAIAATSDKPLTGANIAEGLKRIVPPGTNSEPGSTNINAAVAVLSSGKNIDYNGASGPLNFDIVTGEAPSDIQLWCIPTVDSTPTGKAAPAVNSGIFFDAAKDAISGPTLDPLDPSVKATCKY